MSEQLHVIEIFRSIQGESTLSGLPCTFVRLAGCNLHCAWCDTGYAAEGEGDVLAIEEILARIDKFGIRLVCITGGEPLMQTSAPTLAGRLLEDGFAVSVETNGSLDISALPPGVWRVMDVKCPSSGECGSLLESNLDCLNGEDNLKFVIADRADFDWAVDFIGGKGLINVCPVLFSPAASAFCLEDACCKAHAAKGLAVDLASWIIESALPVRLQLQLHRLLWPERARGV